MTRSEKLKKLANAVRRYRGITHARSGQWIHCPQSSARFDIARYLDMFGRNSPEEHLKIRNFKDVDEFHAWLKNF